MSFIQFVVLLPSSPYIRQSTSTSTVFSLYSYSLHLDSQRPPSFTTTCTSKSTINNKLCHSSLHDFLVSSLLSYSHINSYTLTHTSICLAAWLVRFLINPYSQSQGTHSHRSLTIFWISLQLKPCLPQPPGAKCTCLPDVMAANTSKGR